MRALMEKDPRAFERQAMSSLERAQLPRELQPLVEHRVKARGSFGVYCALPIAHDPASESDHDHRGGLAYEVRLQGVTYRAFVAGRWPEQRTVREATIEGVVLGDAIALGDAPTPEEQAAAGGEVVADAPSLGGPNTVLYMIAQFSDETNAPIDDATALNQMAVLNTFWLNNSGGTVSIRGLVNAGQVMDIVHIILPQPMSYGSTYNSYLDRLLSDARAAAAAAGYNSANYNLDLVVTSNQGFGYAGRAYISGQGAHLVKPYTSLRTAGHELGHNLGLYHANYWRTDATRPFGKDSVPSGYVADSSGAEWVEYGHYFSVMSAQYSSEMDDPTKPHYAPAEKARLGWLSGSAIRYVNGSGTNRLFRLDQRDTVGTPRSIRIETPATDYTGSGRYYWLSYRHAPWSTAQNWFRNGLQVDVARSGYGSDGAIMLDMTPYSKDAATPFFDPNNRPGGYWTIDNNDKLDGALVVGRTFSDPEAGIHITPVGSGNQGTNEEYIDVVIQLGTFPGNRPPVITAFSATTNQAAVNQSVNFSVTASDPDGDPLAYAWDFDQVQTWTSSGLNSPTAVKSWPSAGQYRVTVSVSDMKGHSAVETCIVTVGAPANARQIWGRAVWGGQPVSDARVWTTNGATVYQAWTDSEGMYALTDLASTNAYTVQCARAGLTFSNQFPNPVSVVSGDAYGKDFYALETLSGGGGLGTLKISGQVTDGGVGVAGVEVCAGGRLAITDGAGNYQLTNLVNGTYAVVPRRESWTFSPSSQAVTLTSADSGGNDFARLAPYSVSGSFNGVPAASQDPAPTVYLSSGRSVRASRLGTGGNRYWGYTLNGVPAGQFSLSAELAGYRLVPAGFTNPLSVAGNLANLNFNGSAAPVAGAISGRVTELGLPRTGVLIEVKQGVNVITSTATDADGCYRSDSLTNGSYTVVPSQAGYSFVPASLPVSSVPAIGKDFAAGGSNQPPRITSITANPQVVPSAAATATLAAVASGSAPLSYRWDAVLGRGPVTFSVNDAPAAASAVAAFQAAGAYTFRVRVTDSHGFSATSNVSLTVNAGAGAMVVAPYQMQLGIGETVSFHADAWDELGNRIAVSPLWSVSGGGVINSNGLLCATLPGGPHTVTATAGALQATATFTVGTNVVSVPRPSLSIAGPDVNRTYLIRFRNGVSGRNYRIEYAEDVIHPVWQSLGTATANASGLVEFPDTPPIGSRPRIYRAVCP